MWAIIACYDLAHALRAVFDKYPSLALWVMLTLALVEIG